MRAMAVAMVIFLVAIARATFIESSHGIQAAKLWVYNALWFEILLVFLAVNLIANIVRYKMWQRQKIAMLSFHLSFIIILIGAGVTRFTGYEGLMLIREGESSDIVYSSDPYLMVFDAGRRLKSGEKMMLSDITSNDFTMELDFAGNGKPLKIEYVDFLPKHIDSLIINDTVKGNALLIVTIGDNGRDSVYVTEKEACPIGDSYLVYGDTKVPAGINVYKKDGVLMMRANIPVQYLPMAQMQSYRQLGIAPPDSAYKTVPANTNAPFQLTTLYMLGGKQFVFRGEIPHAKKYKMPSGRKDAGSDYLLVRASEGNDSKIVTLEGGMGMIPTPEQVQLNGHTYRLEYGAKEIRIPFAVKCNDFIIERYPGSDVASSYASDLEIMDKANNYFKKKRVFMNNVIDYNGYRFFQSGFDEDEKGTRLSVNCDYWGTTITYVGYLLMAVGMVLSLFAPAGRFRDLLTRLKKSHRKRAGMTAAVLALLTLSWGNAWSQEQPLAPHDHDHADHAHTDHDNSHTVVTSEARPGQMKKSAGKMVRFMSKAHSDELAQLLVQDFDGRIVPLHTVCDQLLRKLYRSNKYEEKNAVQTVMSMHMYPEYWLDVKIIQVPAAVREKYKLKDHASFLELTDAATGQFKWLADYNNALRKKESERGETEKKLIKLVEKHQVFLGLVNWQYMKLIPLKNDPGNTWYVPLSPELTQKDPASSRMALLYLAALNDASVSGNYREAVKLLGNLIAFQRATAPADILPSERHVKVEISYNKMGIFGNAEKLYLAIGLFLMITFFIRIFIRSSGRSDRIFTILRRIFVGLLIITFAYHGAGIAMRWYISGHASWSNGYEAVVFIAWVTMIAGLIFSRANPGILAGTALLAAFMIMVTELNLLDPEITPLQPVLKSYWLMIHVAIITGSYGFLGLACILGLFNMVLYITRTKKNAPVNNRNINELTYVSEMTMTIGLFMLTIGTFLGGVWANESWGRYWGWDPKETWALVSVLVYAVILHLRFIPGLKSKFTFNLVSMWGYSAILFTFFGVNFILVGLHSYAQGDGSVSLPNWVIFAGLFFLLLTIAAAVCNSRYNKQQRIENEI